MKRPIRNPLSEPSARILLRLRWIVVAVGLSVVLLELFEDALVFDPRLPEMLLFGLIMPALGWLLLTILSTNMLHRTASETRFQRHQQFAQRLEHCQNWNELTRFVVEFTGTLLPVDHASLYIYDHRRARISFVTEWNADRAVHSPVDRHTSSSCQGLGQRACYAV